jgi:RNA polymerase sigma-70 factor (ECF subfamily)
MATYNMPMSNTPEALARRFEALLNEHRRLVLHVAWLYAGPSDERHDLVQEICHQLWRAFPRYDETRRFSTWAWRIALNTAISHLRQASARRDHFEPWNEELAEAIAADAPDGTAERLAELQARIAELGALDRSLILLYLDDKPHAEIAEILGITETNVATRIGRIKQRFRERMAGDTA